MVAPLQARLHEHVIIKIEISEALFSLMPRVVSSLEEFARNKDHRILDNLIFFAEHGYRLVVALRDHREVHDSIDPSIDHDLEIAVDQNSKCHYSTTSEFNKFNIELGSSIVYRDIMGSV